MKIKYASVRKLSGRYSYDIDFNDDVNIITGVNGSGKSSFIKLLWYMISGNLSRIPDEIEIGSAIVETDLYTLEISMAGTPTKEPSVRDRSMNVRYHERRGKVKREFSYSIMNTSFSADLEEVSKSISSQSGSLFFPTYRRVEWGSPNGDSRRRLGRSSNFGESSALEVIGKALDRVSLEISIRDHKFVTSASVDDIIVLLTQTYANVSKVTNNIQSSLSEKIIGEIEKFDEVNSSESFIMQSIKQEIIRTNQARDRLMLPFSRFSELAGKVITGKHVKLTPFITIGEEGTKEVPSYLLSAGEKQMISFLCYNALYKNRPFIIDEPELSLHTDWQRTLMPLLISQSTGNQFIVVTHSPFIYSKYEDKEIIFNKDRGNSEEEGGWKRFTLKEGLSE